MPPRYVKQRHDQGCAIATIAMVTGSSYQRVLNRAFPRGPRKVGRGKYLNIALTPERMVKIIRSFGVPARLSRREWMLQTTSIMVFDWFAAADLVSGTHAVVWLPGQSKILDPGWIDNLGVEFYVQRWRAGGRTTIEIPNRID